VVTNAGQPSPPAPGGKKPSVTGPLVPRQMLAQELRRLREEANLTLDQVATALEDISTSKLSRLENAQGSPRARDVRDLAQLYGIAGTDLADKLDRWVRAARRQGWWSGYSQEIWPGLDAHLAYESDATKAHVYTIPILPVLLQTPDYSRADYKSREPWRSEEALDQLIEIRTRRQQALRFREGLPPLELVAVTHESSLRQRVGSAQTMRAQLDTLMELSTAPNIQLYVLPFTAQPVFTCTCSYAYFEYGEEIDQDIVHIETHAGFRHLEKSDEVKPYRRYNDDLVTASMTMDKSRALIREIRDEL
jgi:transcriptional regulator with XRE-family HTH domain